MGLSMPEIIRKKRDKQELTSEEMRFFVEGVVSRTIDDSQTGAMLMAMYLNKLSTGETISLTKAMIASGETLSFPGIDARLLVDKHSTGGVGDKISLLLAPALAACGLKVPMISGRGLGYTGGTLDKLESIPGFQVEMNLDQMIACLENSGCFICGATNVLAPADSFLYKIRDITSTVEDPSLIVASILSKKAAEGIETLVMDVKFGRGCLYKTAEDARRMAELLQRVGEKVGLAVRVVLSEMNVPLGKFVGNSLEIVESVQCLRSEARNSVTELTKFLGGVALVSKGMARTVDEGERMIQDTFDNFTALSCFRKMLLSQGVSEPCAEAICSGDYWKVLPAAPHTTRLRSPEGGIVVGIDALDIGKACWHLGAGRFTADSGIDHSVGVLLLKTVGDRVEKGEPWLEVHHSDVTLRPEVENLIQSSLKVAKRATNLNPKLKTILI